MNQRIATHNVAVPLLLSLCVLTVCAEDVTHSEANNNNHNALPLWGQLTMAVVLIMLSAVFAGLTIGIMGLDTLSLEIIAASGSEPDKSYAATLLPVRKKGHWALSTLILGNMWANVMIAQFCADVNPEGGGGGIAGFLLSTGLILIFAEILPMSICKSSDALKIASKGVPLLNVFLIILSPIAWPLGKFLDWLIPHDAGQIYDRNELKRLMVLHCDKHGDKSGLLKSELQLMLGAMEFHETVVGDIMTKLEDVFMVDADDVVTSELLQELWTKGHSRVPVCNNDRTNIVGILFVKDLILVNATKGLTVRDVLQQSEHRVFTVNYNVKLPAMLKIFQQGSAHLVIVEGDVDLLKQQRQTSNDGAEDDGDTDGMIREREPTQVFNPDAKAPVGILTLEDVIEKLIRAEIYDEYDDAQQHMGAPGDSFSENSPAAVATPAVREPRSSNSVHHTHPNRVNFYSYYVRPDEDVDLTPEQWTAAAQYLVNTVDSFVLWRVNQVRDLLLKAGDEQFRPLPADTASTRSDDESSVSSPVGSVASLTRRLSSKVLPKPRVPASQFFEEVDPEHVLYVAGEPCDYMTILLSGTIAVQVGSAGFYGEKHTFSVIGEAALTVDDYRPDFSAKVTAPSRIVRISKALYTGKPGSRRISHGVGLSSGKSGSGSGTPENAASPVVPHVISTASLTTPFGSPATRTTNSGARENPESMHHESMRHNDDKDELLPNS